MERLDLHLLISGMQFYEEACFVEQEFVMDDSLKIKELLKQTARETGASMRLSGFARVQCGQGLEESKKEFASEVAETLERTA